MSIDLRDIREISNDTLTKFTWRLSKKLAKFQNDSQTEKLENKEDIYSAGQDVSSVIKLHNFTSTKYFDFATAYYPPFEPDHDKLKLWIRGRNTGNSVTDWSTYGNETELIGDPRLIDGTPFDLGISTGGVKSTALRFNETESEFVAGDYIRVSDASVLRVSGLGGGTGLSYFMRVRFHDLEQSKEADRRLFEKKDDATPNYGAISKITPSGRVQFQVVIGGNTYVAQTGTGVITTEVVYDIWMTYTASGNIIHIYINNVDQSLTTPSAISWSNSTDDFGMRIMKRGPTDDSGYVNGDLYDFRMYRNKVVSATEVGYMNTNKWTIVDIPFGEVMVTDYYATYIPAALGGYTTTGYTTTGYTT